VYLYNILIITNFDIFKYIKKIIKRPTGYTFNAHQRDFAIQSIACTFSDKFKVIWKLIGIYIYIGKCGIYRSNESKKTCSAMW